MKRIDYTGQKLYKLTIIGITDKVRGVNKRRLWEAICECGKTTYIDPNDVKNGNTKSCGCHRVEQGAINGFYNGTSARMYEPHISSARYVWKKLYSDIDFDVFLSISKLPCMYCGREPHKTVNVGKLRSGKEYTASQNQLTNGNFTYNGLDRIDSSIGHTKDNVVPCCFTCNVMKTNHSLEFFLSHIERIYNHLSLHKT